MGTLLDLALSVAANGPLPSELAREQRRAAAVRMLNGAPAPATKETKETKEVPSDQNVQRAFVAGEPTEAGVPVMVAIRTAEHSIITGELMVPRDRWDPWMFLRFLQERDRQ